MNFTSLKKYITKNNISVADVAMFFTFGQVENFNQVEIVSLLKSSNIELLYSKDNVTKLYNKFQSNVDLESLIMVVENLLTQKEKKKSGSFYTRPVVVKHMVNQSIKMYLTKVVNQELLLSMYMLDEINDFYNPSIKSHDFLKNKSLSKEQLTILYDSLLNVKILEPTSGAGSFIYYILSYLGHLLKATGDLIGKTFSIVDLIKNTYANDNNKEVMSYSKLIAIKFALDESKTSAKKSTKYISKNFTSLDFSKIQNHNFDIIIGNPPYLEVKKNEFGETNIYSHVMRKLLSINSKDSVITVVIPNSFQTSKKYKLLREDFLATSDKLFIESYNDRPGSLFSGVHQRLNIIHFVSGTQKQLFTTTHQYARTSEFEQVLDNIEYFQNQDFTKVSKKIEEEILMIINTKDENIMKFTPPSNNVANRTLLVSTRLGLWPKVFMDTYQSKEVIPINVDERISWNLYALLHSSLFYFFWVATSDVWHVTKYDLLSFKFPDTVLNDPKLISLGKKLQKGLENTKKYIGSKQVQFEYKHKTQKQIIDEIDDVISTHYQMTKPQLEYVKSFAEKYRMGLPV